MKLSYIFIIAGSFLYLMAALLDEVGPVQIWRLAVFMFFLAVFAMIDELGRKQKQR